MYWKHLKLILVILSMIFSIFAIKGRSRMKILCYGSLNIDMIFSVPHFVQAGETLSSSSLKKSAGGKGANQAAALAKAGCDTYMAGKVGEDGRFLVEVLESYSVDCSNVVITGNPSGQAIIQLSSDSQNAIILLAGENKNIKEAEVDNVLSFFGKGAYDAEIARGCCITNYHNSGVGIQVIGGASKIWKAILTHYSEQKLDGTPGQINSIVYYTDSRYYDGRSIKHLMDSPTLPGKVETLKETPSFMNYWTELGVAKNREPARHSFIMQQMREGKILVIPNPGTVTYCYTR